MSRRPVPPMRAALPTLSAWVEAWVKYRIELARTDNPSAEKRQAPTKTPHAYICGSIGYDAYLFPNGSVWVSEYEMVDPDMGPFTYYEATGTQRTYAIVCASSFSPELRRLLPRRSRSARDCEACGGAGMDRNSSFPCKPCGGLGWTDSSPLVDPLAEERSRGPRG